MTDEDEQATMIPDDALRRLEEMRPGSPRALFTSDLTVNEFLLVREAGFHPLGLVLGSSIYHVGLQIGRWSQNMELDRLSQAMYHARELAMTRMEEEAEQLGADVVQTIGRTCTLYRENPDLERKKDAPPPWR